MEEGNDQRGLGFLRLGRRVFFKSLLVTFTLYKLIASCAPESVSFC